MLEKAIIFPLGRLCTTLAKWVGTPVQVRRVAHWRLLDPIIRYLRWRLLGPVPRLHNRAPSTAIQVEFAILFLLLLLFFLLLLLLLLLLRLMNV